MLTFIKVADKNSVSLDIILLYFARLLYFFQTF